MNHLRSYLRNFDWILLAAVLLLVAFGLVEIYSVALGQGDLNQLNFKKQLFFAASGFILLFVFAFVDYRLLRSLNRYVYGSLLIVLLAVLVLGKTMNGTKGWFSVFGLGIQPVEFAKAVLILFLARYFSRLATRVKTTRHLLFSALGTLLPIILILLQPDFGSAVILGIIWLVMVIAAGFDKKYLLSIVGLGLIVLVIAWLFLFKTYQKERILNFISPGKNSLESGYNMSQAMIAVGSGGLTGKGVGYGSQSQLKFLPEAHTDFIFAVISEELGFLGVMLVLLFYSILFWRCFKALPEINNDFGIYFLIGSGGLIFIQMFINIGMNLGIMPIVGLPLPFISYGGSSLISLLILVGVIENIIIKSKISY